VRLDLVCPWSREQQLLSADRHKRNKRKIFHTTQLTVGWPPIQKGNLSSTFIPQQCVRCLSKFPSTSILAVVQTNKGAATTKKGKKMKGMEWSKTDDFPNANVSTVKENMRLQLWTAHKHKSDCQKDLSDCDNIQLGRDGADFFLYLTSSLPKNATVIPCGSKRWKSTRKHSAHSPLSTLCQKLHLSNLSSQMESKRDNFKEEVFLEIQQKGSSVILVPVKGKDNDSIHQE